MKQIVFLVTSLLLVVPFSSADSTTPQERGETFASEARKIDEHQYRTAEQAERYRKIFEKYYNDNNGERSKTAEQLINEYNASAQVFFYTLDEKYIKSMRRSLKILDSKNLAKKTDYDRMYRSLIAAHDFNGAKELNDIKKLGYQDSVNTVPNTKFQAGRSEWLVSKIGASLKQVNYTMPSGPVVIMITQPNCHFSQTAIRDIEKNPKILARMHPILKLLAPPSTNFEFVDYQNWNNSKPQFSMSVMHKVSEWPEVSDWATPNFYFFKNQLLVATVTGWPAKGHIAELENALNLIGAK